MRGKDGRFVPTHGMFGMPEYDIWNGMMQRCNCKTNNSYPNYGGRGIKVCDRWKDPRNFYADMGKRPEDMSIERNDLDGDYSPDNCKWLLKSLQNRHRRDTKYLTVQGVTKPLVQWAEEKGIKRSTLSMRVYVGKWSHERAVLTQTFGGKI